jgi:hypothetical protein
VILLHVFGRTADDLVISITQRSLP